MRFYKAKIILLASVLVVGFLYTPAKADNANPPKILDLVQVTQGPYKPGDLVTYKIIFTGGDPGLESGVVRFYNLGEFSFNEAHPTSDVYGKNGLISFALPTLNPGSYGPWEASIKDKTGLRSKSWRYTGDWRKGPLSFIVSDYIFKPIIIGEVMPVTLMTHTLDLQMIPKNLKIGDLFELPKYSSVNAPTYYSVKQESSSICKVIRDYEVPVLPGGQLQILNDGLCKLSMITALGSRASYSKPEIISPVPKEELDSASILTFQVGIEKTSSSKKTLTCVKGKLSKKVTAVNPKCPAGYKKA
jgi:hypothetical protein